VEKGDISKRDLAIRLKKYVESHVEEVVNKQLLQKRVLSCSSCSKLHFGESCLVLGFCSSSTEDFYNLHLNREKGRCPIGRW